MLGTAKSLCQFVIKTAVIDSYISLVASERRRKKGGSIMRAIGGSFTRITETQVQLLGAVRASGNNI